jgi:acetylornithine deacetylase
MENDVLDLASRMIALDTRSSISNSALADLIVEKLAGFKIERLDFDGTDGVRKSALVALGGRVDRPFLALSGHMDTVPPIGWSRDPFNAEVEAGRLYGLGSSDMKGPMAAAIVAAQQAVREQTPVMLLLTCDEETNKAGARKIVAESRLLALHRPAAIVVAEPTSLAPLRGHRVDVQFDVRARGVAAHSSTADGRNANLGLIPFLSEMRNLHFRLREDPALQDPAYSPTWCDLNIIVDNHGVATNMTPALATCRMKFRYSKAVSPDWVVDAISEAAERNDLELDVRREGAPPELPPTHPLVARAERMSGRSARVAGFGSDASQFSAIAPTILLGPGSMAQAHQPEEYVTLEELTRAPVMFRALMEDLGQ